MNWRSAWENTVREISFSTPIDNIDTIDKTPGHSGSTTNSVNTVNIVNAPPKPTIADEPTAEMDLFLYLRDSISTGGPYKKLWPQVRQYLKRELPVEMFLELDGLASNRKDANE